MGHKKIRRIHIRRSSLSLEFVCLRLLSYNTVSSSAISNNGINLGAVNNCD